MARRPPPPRGRNAPPPPPVWSGRRLAYVALFEFESRRAFVGNVLEDLFRDLRPTGQERGFAMELACGCVRRMITLDLILETCVTRPREAIEDGLWTLLRLGAYQLLFMRGLAPHAAVHETVELAGIIGMPRWQGMINAALRQLQREYIPEAGLEEVKITRVDELRPENVVIGFHHSAGSDAEANVYSALTLKRAMAGIPKLDLTQFLARTLSFPEWLIGRWKTAGGEAEALRLATWFNTQGRMSLRVNVLRTNREAVLASFQAQGIPCEPGEFPESIVLHDSLPITGLPEFLRGEVTVQDTSAMSVAALLDPQPGERVWDVCAAPGGKTTHLSERMRNQGSILATDIHSPRLQLISETADRLGLTNIAICLIAPDAHDAPREEFDAILLDVPCSNTGVLGKRPEARWRISPSDLNELVPLQKGLVDLALSRLRSGGRLAYSTCSIEPDENARLMQTIVGGRDNVELVKEIHHVPGRPADGGYQALLRKIDA